MANESQESGHRFAARVGKETLYKFRPYSTKTDRARVREILVAHEVYFSRPSQLNDPFDMSPRFEKTTREQLIRGAERYLDRTSAPQLEREHTLRTLRSCDLDEYTKGAELRSRKRLEQGYRVLLWLATVITRCCGHTTPVGTPGCASISGRTNVR